jgi:predicted O-methyltransferase YrrM
VTTPPLVERAVAFAARRGFSRSCAPEVGALLHVLAARRGIVRAAEIGTGCGVGTAWIVSALAPGVPFFTAEIDSDLAAATRELFAEDPDATVLTGDWRETLPAEAPFDFLFLDAAKQRPDLDGATVLGLLTPGATIVLDDLTPGRTGPDPVRDFWLNHPHLVSTELLTSLERAAIVAVKVKG